MTHGEPIAVTFYTRPGCHLCDDVADQLEALAARWPLKIAAQNILDDLELHRRFWDKIPVVEVGGETLQAPIAPARLAAAVARAGATR
jgi:thiol-disulfide isomerase/thioredoxin